MNRKKLGNLGDYSQALDEVRKVAGAILGLSGVIRFKGTPFMNRASRAGYINPVGSHTSECCQLWSMLRVIMPNLAKLVDSATVYDILANHDNGELKKGDVSLHDKANGVIDDKTREIHDVVQLYRHLPQPLRSRLVQQIRDFEADEEADVSLEIRLARLIDSLQANIVVLEKGQDLAVLANNIPKIIRLRVIPRARILISILKSQGHLQAAREVQSWAQHHLLEWQSKRADIDLSEVVER